MGGALSPRPPPQEGVPAIHQLLRWREGRFAFLKNASVSTVTPLQSLLTLMVGIGLGLLLGYGLIVGVLAAGWWAGRRRAEPSLESSAT